MQPHQSSSTGRYLHAGTRSPPPLIGNSTSPANPCPSCQDPEVLSGQPLPFLISPSDVESTAMNMKMLMVGVVVQQTCHQSSEERNWTDNHILDRQTTPSFSGLGEKLACVRPAPGSATAAVPYRSRRQHAANLRIKLNKLSSSR
jgi:hypothetical protein